MKQISQPHLLTTYLIDSHCHIHDKSCFPDGAEEIIARAKSNHVRQIIVIGTADQDSMAAKNFANQHENVFWSYGIHPEYASTDWASAKDGWKNLSAAHLSSKLIGIGEVGLDYHYKPFDRAVQIRLLEEMLELANRLNLPLIFHVREAFADFWPIIDNQHVKSAVLHSFSDTKEQLSQVLSRGFYVGVNGLATFANIPLPPLERMLLETDAPYLTPVPFRGKINECAYIKNIADYLSTKMGIPPEEIERRTTKNVQTLFHLPHPVFRAA